MKLPILSFSLLLLVLNHLDAASPVFINFAIANGDGYEVNLDESALTNLVGVDSPMGSAWNNIQLRQVAANGSPSIFTDATQSGNQITLSDINDSGTGISLTSAGTFHSTVTNVSGSNAAETGDGGLFSGALLLNNSEVLTLTGLSEWAPNGYEVYGVFDIGSYTRLYSLVISDGVTSNTFWTHDTAGADSDPDDDGIGNWTLTTASASTDAVVDANYATEIYHGNQLTIAAGNTGSRAVLSGLLLVPLELGEAATISSFVVSPDVASVGDTVTLSWEVLDADSVEILGIGSVASSGSLDVVLTDTDVTSWQLQAQRGARVVSREAAVTIRLGSIDVYLLSGQSNMVGQARTSEIALEDFDLSGFPYFFNSSASAWNGSYFRTLTSLSEATFTKFGPELGFADQMRRLRPAENMALIKYSRGGRSLEINFDPGASAADRSDWGDEFTLMVDTVEEGLSALQAAGWTPVIQGMLWYQGEQDAKDGLNVAESSESADDYGQNLAHFIARVREQFAGYASPSGIRFVSTQVLPYAPAGGDVATRFPGRELVRQAFLDLAEDSGHALAVENCDVVETNSEVHLTHEQVVDGYNEGDEVHVAAAAQIAIGQMMAYKVLRLEPTDYEGWAFENGVSGMADDDDDRDGIPNIVEYATTGSTSSLALGQLLLSGDVVFEVSRNLEARDVDLEVQFSRDLKDWTTEVPDLVSSRIQPNGTSLLSYGVASGDDEQGFFRVVVSR